MIKQHGLLRNIHLSDIFSRYQNYGGEEYGISLIHRAIEESNNFEIRKIWFENSTWVGETAPPLYKRAIYSIFNPDSIETLRAAERESPSNAWIIHNPFPVASMGIYSEAKRIRMPVIQYLHNWRPISLSGSYWLNHKIPAGRCHYHYFNEIITGAWQNSVLKTTLMATGFTIQKWFGWRNSISAWICLSCFMKNKFIEAGFPESKLHVLGYPWIARDDKTEDSDTTDEFLFLGRLIPEKGVQVLIDAWKHLEVLMPQNCPKLIIAGNGELLNKMQINAKGLSNIEFKGHVSGLQKEELLRRCRAVLVPSVWWEPLGLVVYEAYDFCKPVLAAESGGLTETVQHGITGLLHQPGNSKQLAHQVMSIFLDQQGSRQMGIAGRKWLENNTSPQRWREKFTEIFQTIS